jgi:hypothetical protein
MVQLSLLAGLDLLQLLREPLISILEGVLGVVVDDGTVGGLDTGVDLKRLDISNARQNQRSSSPLTAPHIIHAFLRSPLMSYAWLNHRSISERLLGSLDASSR